MGTEASWIGNQDITDNVIKRLNPLFQTGQTWSSRCQKVLGPRWLHGPRLLSKLHDDCKIKQLSFAGQRADTLSLNQSVTVIIRYQLSTLGIQTWWKTLLIIAHLSNLETQTCWETLLIYCSVSTLGIQTWWETLLIAAEYVSCATDCLHDVCAP